MANTIPQMPGVTAPNAPQTQNTPQSQTYTAPPSQTYNAPQSQASTRPQSSPATPWPESRQSAPQDQTEPSSRRSQSGLVDRLAHTADETTARAVEGVQSSRAQARAGIEKQQAEISTRIRGLSEALRSSGDSLEDNEPVSRLLAAASDQVERLASYVDEASARSLASDLHAFARNRPAWFFGGAFLGGLALGRFVKSSARMAAEGGVNRSSGEGDQNRSSGQGEYARTTGGVSYARPTGEGRYARTPGEGRAAETPRTQGRP